MEIFSYLWAFFLLPLLLGIFPYLFIMFTSYWIIVFLIALSAFLYAFSVKRYGRKERVALYVRWGLAGVFLESLLLSLFTTFRVNLFNVFAGNDFLQIWMKTLLFLPSVIVSAYVGVFFGLFFGEMVSREKKQNRKTL
jgi:hypothetical protein